MDSLKYTLEDLKKALEKLEEVLKLEKNEYTRDSALLRFEFSFELAWKAMQKYARLEGVECYSPRECMKKAFVLKLIEDDEAWFEMLKDRNLIAHTYDEKTAEEIYRNLSEYLKLLKKLLNILQLKALENS